MNSLEMVNGNIRRWRGDANAYVKENFGATPDLWQRLALSLVSNPRTRRLALKACKGPGKTAVLAWIILWFLTCFEESKVGCTSITEGNIDTNLWPEISKWLQRSSYLSSVFTWSSSRVSRKGNPNWFAVKRTWPKSGDSQQQANALAGIHADNVMFVLDESGGIPQAVMVTAEAVLSTFTEAMELAGCRALVLQAGNPTHTSGPLHRACTVDRALWEVVTITGDPDDPMRSPRISLKWATEEIAKYGRDNPWVMVNVLGQFPPASINSLLGIEDVEAAMNRRANVEHFSHMQKRLGIDVARFGDDITVLFPRQGVMSWRPIEMRNENTVTIANRGMGAVVNWQRQSPGDVLTFVDDTGHWGHGVIDTMSMGGFQVLPVIYSGKASDVRYKNRRSLNWVRMSEWVKHGGCLPKLPALVPQLTEITYTFVGGLLMLEDKDQLKARIQVSPDHADALSQTFDMPEMPNDIMHSLGKRNSAARDFNPYELPASEFDDDGRRHAIRDHDPLG